MTNKNEKDKATANAHNDVTKEANAKNIEGHKQAAAQHTDAAKHHLEAAKNHEMGNHEKAAQNTILAYGHAAIAGEFLSDDAKHHAQELKQTKYK